MKTSNAKKISLFVLAALMVVALPAIAAGTFDFETLYRSENNSVVYGAYKITVEETSITRTVTGLVFPMAVNDYGYGAGFLEMHDIVVELRPSFGTPAQPGLSTKAMQPDGNSLASFTLENVPFGNYTLCIKRPGYLVRTMYVTVSADDSPTVALTPPGAQDNGVFNLWWGDCNDDYRIDNEDIIAIMELTGFNLTPTDPLYDPSRDLNADGTVNQLDVDMVNVSYAHYNSNVTDYPGAINAEDFFS